METADQTPIFTGFSGVHRVTLLAGSDYCLCLSRYNQVGRIHV